MGRLKLNLICFFSIPYTAYLHLRYLIRVLDYICKSWFHDVNCAVVGSREAMYEITKIPIIVYADLSNGYPSWFRIYTAGINNMISRILERYLNSLGDEIAIKKQ